MTENLENPELLIDCVEKINGRVVERAQLGEDDLDFLLCRHGQQTYVIREHPEQDFYEISFIYGLISDISGHLDESIVRKLTGSPPEGALDSSEDSEIEEEIKKNDEASFAIIEEGEQMPPEMEASKKLLESIDDEIMEHFKFNLFQELSNPLVATEIYSTEKGALKSFRIEKKTFPNDDGFNLTEFNRSVQAVVSIGVFGKNTISSQLIPEIESRLEEKEDE